MAFGKVPSMRNQTYALVAILSGCATSGSVHPPEKGGIVHGYTQGKLGGGANIYWFDTPSGPVWVDAPLTTSETKKLRGNMVRPFRVYVTAAQPERFGGLPVLKADEIPAFTTPQVALEIRDHGDNRLGPLHEASPKEVLAHVDPPGPAIEERTHDMVGEIEVEMLPLGPACSESSLALFLPHTGELVAGDVIFGGEHPDLTWGRSTVWQERLTELKNLEPKHVYPGHGTPGGPELIDQMLGYLKVFHDAVAEKVKQGGPQKLPLADVKSIKKMMVLRFPNLKHPERLDVALPAEYAVQLAAVPPPPPPPPVVTPPVVTAPAPAAPAAPPPPAPEPTSKSKHKKKP